MVAKPARKSVAIVVPLNAQSLDVSGPLDAFLEANRHSPGGAVYEVRLVAAGAGRTIRVGGMSLVTDSSIFDDVRPIDTMLVAGTPTTLSPIPARISMHGYVAAPPRRGGTARYALARSFSVRRACSTG